MYGIALDRPLSRQGDAAHAVIFRQVGISGGCAYVDIAAFPPGEVVAGLGGGGNALQHLAAPARGLVGHVRALKADGVALFRPLGRQGQVRCHRGVRGEALPAQIPACESIAALGGDGGRDGAAVGHGLCVHRAAAVCVKGHGAAGEEGQIVGLVIDDPIGLRLMVLVEQRFPFIGRVELQRVICGIAHPERRFIRNGAFLKERERASEHAAAGVCRVARLDGQAAVLEGEAAGIFGHAVVLGFHAHRPAPLVILALVAESHCRSVGRLQSEGAVPGEGQHRAPGPIQCSAVSGVSDLVFALQLNGKIPKIYKARRAERLDFLQICAVECQLVQLYPRDLLTGQQLSDRFIRDVEFAVIPVSVGDLAAVIPTFCVGHCAVAQHVR